MAKREREEDSAAEGASKRARTDRRGRKYTVSIALPGSVVDNAQTPELQTYLVGQIARTAAVFCVDEIVVFDDQIGRSRNVVEGGDGYYDTPAASADGEEGHTAQAWDPNAFMARLLQYIETPQCVFKTPPSALSSSRRNSYRIFVHNHHHHELAARQVLAQGAIPDAQGFEARWCAEPVRCAAPHAPRRVVSVPRRGGDARERSGRSKARRLGQRRQLRASETRLG